jgi:hypothetical protein
LFYNGRASIEKSNREFLYDYPLGKIPTQSWTANVAFFQPQKCTKIGDGSLKTPEKRVVDWILGS